MLKTRTLTSLLVNPESHWEALLPQVFSKEVGFALITGWLVGNKAIKSLCHP